MWIGLGLFLWTIIGLLYFLCVKKMDDSLSEFMVVAPATLLTLAILWSVGGFDQKEEK